MADLCFPERARERRKSALFVGAAVQTRHSDGTERVHSSDSTLNPVGSDIRIYKDDQYSDEKQTRH